MHLKSVNACAVARQAAFEFLNNKGREITFLQTLAEKQTNSGQKML